MTEKKGTQKQKKEKKGEARQKSKISDNVERAGRGGTLMTNLV